MKTLLMMSFAFNLVLMAAFFFNLNRLYLVQEKLADALHRLGLHNRTNVDPKAKSPQAVFSSPPISREMIVLARLGERIEARCTPEPFWIND